ncbi:hypothetical protein D9757_004853 [Collybiopsis confluens]|uniref:Cytochrome P450 n=1 Tax=Collybiopsis confluens TaxID=2823264 RepID=A0A8H5MCB0_9AGAR|nr:hypothetical protein D9757_004853 [Collybiopsis confluens]
MPSLIIVDFAALTALILLLHRISTRCSPSLPPGPRRWPLIGSALDFPKKKPHEAYSAMGRHYHSDLVYLDVAGMSLLVLNSTEAANDLFVERYKLYSDRPQFTMASELVGWDFAFSTFPYGRRWREYRALFNQESSPNNLRTHQKPVLQECLNIFLQRILNEPTHFNNHIHFLFGSTMLASAYGISTNDPNNRYIELAKEAVRGATEVAIPGTYIVDVFPLLKYLPAWLPGMGFQKKAAYERRFVEGMVREPMEFVRRNMETGTAKSSMASRHLQMMQDEGSWSECKEETLRNVLGLLYAVQGSLVNAEFVAGSDTTATATKTVILALVCNPESMKKGQAAVDAVIGSDRLPNFGDESSIPYIDAFVMEVLRWRLVSPLGIAHYASKSDTYRGYYIPANTIVIGNSWAILNDPSIYGKEFDVELFRPERFLKLNLDGSETLDRSIPYPEAAFGFGRRICPGRDLAHSALWLITASLLACFNFAKAVDENGKQIHPDMDYLDGFISHPRPFQCVIRPRSRMVEDLIHQSVDGQA